MGLPTNFYNLQFAAPGIRRISYATSFGVNTIPWYQRSRTADFLRKIDYLSVREESAVTICRTVAGVNAEVVVDPTMLFNEQDWLSIIGNRVISSESYIFCYFLGTNPLCRTEANAIAQVLGLPIVTLRHLDEIVPTDERFGDVAPYSIDPAGFVNLIRGAEFVATDSFHGTAFSIIHHKPFATLYRFQSSDRQSTNQRIDSLLGSLGVLDRLVTCPGMAGALSERVLDYEAVDSRLGEWRDKSWRFLEEALS